MLALLNWTRTKSGNYIISPHLMLFLIHYWVKFLFSSSTRLGVAQSRLSLTFQRIILDKRQDGIKGWPAGGHQAHHHLCFRILIGSQVHDCRLFYSTLYYCVVYQWRPLWTISCPNIPCANLKWAALCLTAVIKRFTPLQSCTVEYFNFGILIC